MITQSDIDALIQRIDRLESLVKELAGSLVYTNRKLASTDNNIETIANSSFMPIKLK